MVYSILFWIGKITNEEGDTVEKEVPHKPYPKISSSNMIKDLQYV